MDSILLAIIQAFTEFLPVSSTAHLIVLPRFFDLPTVGRLTEVALHLGTLAVVLIYFRHDVQEGFKSIPSLMKGQWTPASHRWIQVACATIPVVVIGYGIHRFFRDDFRSFQMMGWSSVFFGVLLFLADRRSPAQKRLESMTYRDALIIGLLQVIALIPGASRLGTTLIAARLLGYDRQSSAHFSFLLSIPAILGATVLMMLDMPWEEIRSLLPDLGLAAVVSFILGYGILWGFMRWLKRHTLASFGLYRIAFGLFVLFLFYRFPGFYN